MLQYFITTVPNASWQTLAGGLYHTQDRTALERVKKHFRPQPGTMCVIKIDTEIQNAFPTFISGAALLQTRRFF